MAINLLKKYHSRLVRSLEYESNISGKTTDEYRLDGSEGIFLTSMGTVPLNQYNMTATANRYGTPTEIGNEQQYIPWDYDESYSISRDNANYKDGGYMATVEAIIREQNENVVAPFIEQYFYAQLFKNAGKAIVNSAPTSADILSRLTAIEAAFRNARIPRNNRFVAMGTSNTQLIRLSLTGLEDFTDKALIKGIIGKIGSLLILETADDDLPDGLNMLAWWKRAALNAFDIKEAKAHENPPGINGALVEYRVRGVAAVIGKYAGGVIADIKSGAQQTAPTVTAAGNISSLASADYVMYTTDGSDPRYSASAKKVTSTGAVAHTSGNVLKAAGYKAGKVVSAVASVVTTS